MPWPFPESIKKRACRYLLHRYLDHFLEEKLSLEQLSVDLYQGTGSLAQVPLVKSSLNEILDSLDAPLEIIEGFIQNISVSIPWASLLQENCAVEVQGLEMIFRPRPRIVSGSEPMYWSSFMTDSMQLAKECLNQKLTDDQAEGPQPFEGLEKFAETIETVLRRVKLTFLDTILRIEHIPENSKTGIALEIRIQRIEYRDESANESADINIHHPTAFAHKNLQLSGISLFWHEFPESAKTSTRTSPMQETEPKLSPSWNPKIVSEPHPQFTRKSSDAVLFDPVQIGSCEGKVELELTLKQNEALPMAKLDVEGQIESVNFFLSPRQVHHLLDMLSTILLPGSTEAATVQSKSRRNRPMQQEDQYLIQMELHRYLQKEKLSPGVSAEQSYYETETVRTTSSRAEDDVFFSMADMEMSNSVASLPPLGEPTIDMELSLSSTRANSAGSSPQSATGFSTSWDDYLDHSGQGGRVIRESAFNSKELPIIQRPLRPSISPGYLSGLQSKSHPIDESRPQVVVRLTIGSLSLSVLHIDPLPPPESPLHLDPLAKMASHFFEQFKTFDLSQFPAGDFHTLRPKFAVACPHDHLRLFATGMKLNYEQRRGASSRSLNTDVCINWMELLECLFPMDSLTVTPQYTELITFQSVSETGAHPAPSVQLHYKHIDRRGVQGSQGRLTSVPPKAELQIELGLIQSELDISIVDRLNSLLQPQKLATTEMMASHMYTSFNKHISLRAFTEVFRDDSASPANQRTSVQLTTPMFKMAIRFPIPDLRSDQERGPWFKKSLQKEILHLEFSEAEFKTEFFGSLSHEQLKLELTFKELLGKFQEDPATPPFTFFKVSHDADGDMSTSDSGKFDWPRVVLKVNPTAVHSILERITTEEEEPGSHLLEDEEGGSHSLKDVCDLGRQEPSPFSSRRVMYENEEMVMPGDQFEMGQFQDKTISTSHYVLELMLPNVNLTLPNKVFYEKVYNRINNDLLLWEPAAPSPVETVENVTYGVGLSVASQLINAFGKESLTQLKSTLLQDDDESGSDEETLQFCSSTDPAHRSRRKKKVEQQNKNCQSFLSVLLNVSHGLVTIHTDTKSEDGTPLAEKHGEFWLEIENGSLFSVGKYQGFDDQHYFCLQTNKVFLRHQGMVEDVCAPGDVKLPSKTWSPGLEPTIYQSEEGALTKQAAASVGVGTDSPNMLSIAVKVHHNKTENNMKEILVAVGLRGATLRHRNVPPGRSWYEQIVDFLNIADEPVLGYAHPANATTFHLHLWSCALDYRPLYLPVRALVTVETFTISSNIVLDKYCSTLRIIIDDAALYLSEKCHSVAVNLKQDYVRVLDMGLLEFRITASKPTAERERFQPRFELRCSSDVIHIRTCSDSCAALMNLIQYVASYGDLHPPSKLHTTPGAAAQRSRAGSGDSTACRTSGLAEAEQKLLRDLMIDAMEEMDILPSSPPAAPTLQQSNGIYNDLIQEREPARSDLFLFPDESGGSSQEQSPCSTMILPEHHAAYPSFPSEQPESEDFCILEAPKMAVTRETEPVVRLLNSGPILIKDEHFTRPIKKLDTSKAPLHLPIPEIRYVVKEISVVWHLYGGRDFGTALSARSPVKNIITKPVSSSSQGSPSQPSARHSHSARHIQGGPGRNHDILMEIQFSKVKFQHEVYPQTDYDVDPGSTEHPISRQVFIVQDLEIRDRLASSQMNKFLYLYSSKELPRKAHSNMLTIKALHVSPDSTQTPRECCLRITLMPLRLNIDQDALFFLKDFFTSLAAEVELLIPPEPVQEVRKSPGSEVTGNLSKNGTSPADHGPIITLPGQSKLRPDPLTTASRVPVSELGGPSPAPFRDQPIFFREFRFTSEVPIRLDYHGKHMSMDQGTLAGILIGLAQLNCSELKLKRLCYRHGLLGVDKLISYALNEWLTDIRKNQLPGILGGVGPMHSLVQLVQGLKDLVWLPIEQYRRDGRIVRGLQRGAASFGTSTAMAALELTNRLVQTIQAAAETAYDMVSPVPTTPTLMKTKRISQHRLAHQPVDLREGVAKAYDVVKEGFTDTAHMIYETATREHEQRGMTGAVGGVLRQIPPAVVKPLIVATEATSNVLGGMRNQIQPDARQEESQKWRLGDQ
ncbi:autophagy-related protein 2 homolog B-like isoform X3 [Carcharodon carcharias]|uniref:autophagy-related protein 2 homolog B-like isoform X3 n=1 Tax=Carcharodon carcharias TaxID=13397 RepID=UPI001B7DCEA7|nr:autophagy-related protein 2 homolog B-like isoform X3 [Carcharodon carcharias]